MPVRALLLRLAEARWLASRILFTRNLFCEIWLDMLSYVYSHRKEVRSMIRNKLIRRYIRDVHRVAKLLKTVTIIVKNLIDIFIS